MKNVVKTLGVGIIISLIISCSSVKVTDFWKDANITKLKDQHIMVINKTSKNIVRTRFEKDLVSSLNNKGFNAVESLTMFPNIESEKKLNISEIDEIKNQILSKGIEAVIVTTLKEVEEFENVENIHSGYYINTSPSGIIYRGRYYRNFYRYYGTVYISSPTTTKITSSGKNYVLETVIYDLTKKENNQLLSVITTKIDNPETLGTTSKDFSKKIAKELSK